MASASLLDNAVPKEKVSVDEAASEAHQEQQKTLSQAQTRSLSGRNSPQIPSQGKHSGLAPILTQMPSHHRSLLPNEDLAALASYPTSESLSQPPTSESSAITQSPSDVVTSAVGHGKLSVGPQTIPETRTIDHSLDQMSQPVPLPLSRASSTGRFRSMMSANSFPRRQSRRSASSNVSNSPAHAFLSSWHRGADSDTEPEVKPDDEGQAIGVNDEYIIGRIINKGGFGVVKEIRTRNDRTGKEESFAVKIVRKQIRNDDVSNERAQQGLEHEVSVWRHLQHRHILELRVVFETDYATFCIMDLNFGGTLHEIVRQQRQTASEQGGKSKGLNSKLAKHYAYQLASALRYLHEDIQVCHRDIKLENCLVDSTKGAFGRLRLCDFGLADFLHSGSIDEDRDFIDEASPQSSPGRTSTQSTASIIGTLEYASPKGLTVDRKLFETAGDVWAYGVVVYALCTGDLPFRHAMPSKTIDAILRTDWDENALKQASTSGDGEEVYEMVSGCLRKSIEERWTITDCIASFWFEGARENGDDGDTQWQ